MEARKESRKTLLVLLLLVLAVRLFYLALFHQQLFIGPSTQFEQAFVAINLLEGRGVQTFKTPPAVVEAGNPSRLVDPERYTPASAETLPYIKEVPGYAFFLAFLWLLSGTKLWILAQTAQVVFEVLTGLGLYVLARKYFSRRAAFWTTLVFAFLFFEARSSVVAYKDIFLLYAALPILFFSGTLFFSPKKPALRFLPVCLLSGIGFYFMPSILLYPFFLAAVLVLFRLVNLKTGAALILLAVMVTGLAVFPYQAYVQAHRGEPGVAEPLLWYRFWLGTKVRVFYSTEEERFQEYFTGKLAQTGMTLEELCRQEFLKYVKEHPVRYAVMTLRKLALGMFLVYGNAGDCTLEKSWSRFKAENQSAGFREYAATYPFRILGMTLGTLSISLLFPLAFIAAIILVREKRGVPALLFLHLPLYFLLLHMFFHYEARYLLGTVPGYLPLVGFLLERISGLFRKKRI